ncbi:MAG TPA: DUF4349 domain-containing protein [Candidatus Angelobacter sp.]|nr:DUF4349 domain-containing protein [Candidatus Angelobacter sp.]
MIKKNSHPIEELELMAYLDGELSRERAAAAAAHLEACAECKALANDLRGISLELATWQIESSDAEITARLSVALEDHDRAQQKKTDNDGRSGLRILWPRRRVWPWALAATGLVLIVTASLPNMLRKAVPRAEFSSLWPKEQEIQQAQSVAKGTTAYSYDGQPSRAPTPGYGTMGRLERSHQGTEGLLRDQVRATETKAIGEFLIPTGPMVIRTAELALTTTDFDQARTRMEEILRRHNGYLGDLNVSGTTNSARTLTTTLRVPAGQLDAAMAELKMLGHVDSESQKGEEVSQQYVDLQARLLNARNSERRLTDLLQRTGKLSDVLEVEQAIESVRENIERMEAEKKNLEKQVAFSTVSLKVVEDYKERVQVVPDSTSRRLRNAAVEGYQMMVAGLINLLLFLASWGPSLLLWAAILFFPARWLWRKGRRELF